ncbi:hypothetical protein E6O75_ATG03702 [Venturia nashicola]|uniref:Uncharacterized protein n=1 Tax=Venturia nashicola TaxID=86259 RepID=A0A4Z1PEE5_9PEZI|nr:hypothetical protein E6O75_ATG03702 [Venturia nashicola]
MLSDMMGEEGEFAKDVAMALIPEFGYERPDDKYQCGGCQDSNYELLPSSGRLLRGAVIKISTQLIYKQMTHGLFKKMMNGEGEVHTLDDQCGEDEQFWRVQDVDGAFFQLEKDEFCASCISFEGMMPKAGGKSSDYCIR